MTRRHKLLILLGVLIVTLIFAATYNKGKSFVFRASATGAITSFSNQALVSYCKQGDQLSACDPTNNIFSSSSTSNTVVTTLAGSTPPSQPTSACFTFTAAKPATVTYVLIIVRDGGTEVARIRTPYNSGNITVTDSAFLANLSNKTYNVLVKPDNHLAKAITGNPVTSCAQTAQVLPWGDLQGVTSAGNNQVTGDGVIGPTDIVTVIRGRVQGTYTPSDIVTVIHNYVSGLVSDN